MAPRKKTISLLLILSFLAAGFLGVSQARAGVLVNSIIYIPMIYKANPAPTPNPGGEIANPGFEEGNTGWQFYSNYGDNLVSTLQHHTGSYSAALGNDMNDRDASISQQIYVPSGRSTLNYWQYVISSDVCGQFTFYDYARVLVNGVELSKYSICEDANNNAWIKMTLDLSSYKDRSVQLKVEFHSDSSLESSFYVDDFALVSP